MIYLTYKIEFEESGKTYEINRNYDLKGVSDGNSLLNFVLDGNKGTKLKEFSLSEFDSILDGIGKRHIGEYAHRTFHISHGLHDLELNEIKWEYGIEVASEFSTIMLTEKKENGLSAVEKCVQDCIGSGLEGKEGLTIYDINRICFEAAQIEYSALMEARKRVFNRQWEEKRQKHLEGLESQKKEAVNE